MPATPGATSGSTRLPRDLEDRRITDFVDGLDDAAVATTIRYRRVSTPELSEQPLAHWFNHQTRDGQVHALLTGLAGQAPELDLPYFQRVLAKSAA